MALIKCPECSKEVSDKAINCPQCAYPLSASSSSGQIRIKLSSHFKSMLGASAVVEIKILDSKSNNEIWSGKSGEVASFHLEKPTEVIFNSPAGRPFKTKLLVATIDPLKSKTYELTYLESAFGFPKYMLNAIDVLT